MVWVPPVCVPRARASHLLADDKRQYLFVPLVASWLSRACPSGDQGEWFATDPTVLLQFPRSWIKRGKLSIFVIGLVMYTTCHIVIHNLDSQSVIQSVSHAGRWSFRSSAHQSARQLVSQSVRQSVSPSIRPSARQSGSQSVSQPVNQSVSQSVRQSGSHFVRKPVSLLSETSRQSMN